MKTLNKVNVAPVEGHHITISGTSNLGHSLLPTTTLDFSCHIALNLGQGAAEQLIPDKLVYTK